MPVAKLLGNSTPDTMKAEEGSDSLDTFIRQAVGTEPFFSFSRTGDSPVQWIQLLHALDQPDVPGWPLLAPMKVQMQKCDKCAREFCSSINYRRHMRVHRRSLNVHKDPQKYRDLLGAFWDKLSDDEAKEIMSFKDVNLEEVPGYSIVKNIQANLRKPIFLSLPQAYVKAGSILVEIIQGRPSRLTISSPELFSILDDASERTFLCAGTAESLQKYVFDGEAGKIGLEMKNLIACTSFLVEQKLVKAWVADKDAEALRCQKLLVEEEEAAQRRQAEQLERKRQRKLRQKEQRVKDQSNGVKVDSYATSDISETTPPTETSSPEADSSIPDEQFPAPPEPLQLPNNEENINIEAQIGFIGDLSDSATNWKENDSQHFVTPWQVPKSQKSVRNNFHGNQNVVKGSKREQAPVHKEQRAGVTNGGKVWTKKPKPENGEAEFVKTRVQNDATNQTDQSNCQLMIGSISVTVKSSQRHDKVDNGAEIQENGTNFPTLMFWRPRRGPSVADGGGGRVLEEDVMSEKGVDRTLLPENGHESRDLNGEDTNGSNPSAEHAAKLYGTLFSAGAAKAFLIQRWSEETSRDRTKLALSRSSPEPRGQSDAETNRQPSKSHDRTILGNAENRLGNVLKPKLRTKPEKEKGVKTKYVPKQRAVN